MNGASGSFELLDFQARAARQIADRFELLAADEDRPMFTAKHHVPYFQALSALTGAGKTAILADAVAQMAAGMPVQPVIFWVSRLSAVVNQTFTAMSTGGKYASLLPGFTVTTLEVVDREREHLKNRTPALLVLSTVAGVNQDKDSNLAVHKVKKDKGEESLWVDLSNRLTRDGQRRPLFIVYDEAHNLTDPQTDRLMELRPDAFLVASATMTLRARLQQVITRLRDAGWVDKPAIDTPGAPTKSLVTQIPNKKVVDAGLVKREVVVGGYDSTMETMVDDLLAEIKTASVAAVEAEINFQPRAIYVSQTNIDADNGTTENFHRPFSIRRAPPILIWRHLVTQGVDPDTIAVYCDLKHDKENPLPKGFRLFSGGDKDYEAFTAGGYRHIIFNQALQEGWDDPQVAFAYIDKTMGSPTQVEQVIGRVLRQPGAEHYSDPSLNRATFYIRLDSKQQFKPILEEVQKRIGAEPGGVDIKVNVSLGGSAKSRQLPKSEMTVPKVYIASADAAEAMDDVIKSAPDYGVGGANVSGAGSRQIGKMKVGQNSPVVLLSSAVAHSSQVTARWILRREIRTLYPRVLNALDDSDYRFDVMLDRTSVAAEQFRVLGRELVDAFLRGSTLRIEPTDVHKVGPIDARPDKATKFKNALHPSYEINGLEQKVAEAIDDTGLTWCRNPVNGGWSVPLLDAASTYNFFPDFLVWKGRDIFALDPKAGHILAGDAYRKVLSVQKGTKGPRVFARLISEGKWSDDVKPMGKSGYTIWSWDTAVGKLQAKYFLTLEKAVKGALVA